MDDGRVGTGRMMLRDPRKRSLKVSPNNIIEVNHPQDLPRLMLLDEGRKSFGECVVFSFDFL
jgi:hypothetical protein